MLWETRKNLWKFEKTLEFTIHRYFERNKANMSPEEQAKHLAEIERLKKEVARQQYDIDNKKRRLDILDAEAGTRNGSIDDLQKRRAEALKNGDMEQVRALDREIYRRKMGNMNDKDLAKQRTIIAGQLEKANANVSRKEQELADAQTLFLNRNYKFAVVYDFENRDPLPGSPKFHIRNDIKTRKQWIEAAFERNKHKMTPAQRERELARLQAMRDDLQKARDARDALIHRDRALASETARRRGIKLSDQWENFSSDLDCSGWIHFNHIVIPFQKSWFHEARKLKLRINSSCSLMLNWRRSEMHLGMKSITIERLSGTSTTRSDRFCFDSQLSIHNTNWKISTRLLKRRRITEPTQPTWHLFRIPRERNSVFEERAKYEREIRMMKQRRNDMAHDLSKKEEGYRALEREALRRGYQNMDQRQLENERNALKRGIARDMADLQRDKDQDQFWD